MTKLTVHKESSANASFIKRRQVMLGTLRSMTEEATTAANPIEQEVSLNSEVEFLALIVNDSNEMAKEITLQLTLSMPGCSIMYAPSIEIAKWILKRRKIDLLVSSPLLPDGPVDGLKTLLDSLDSPPDIIVVGERKVNAKALFNLPNYHLVSSRRINKSNESQSNLESKKIHLDQAVKCLGADIRNDLNNPLQEIVAMVFVARSGKAAISTERALEAIDKVAKNMAAIVNKLEDKILKAVTP